MSDYISREEALAFQDELEPVICFPCHGDKDANVYSATKDADLVSYLQSIPAADVRPVVRCRDCKHWKRVRNNCFLAPCELDDLVRSEDFFCADGERKDGDGE